MHERQIFSKEHIFLKLWNEENDSDIKVVTEYIRRIRKRFMSLQMKILLKQNGVVDIGGKGLIRKHLNKGYYQLKRV